MKWLTGQFDEISEPLVKPFRFGVERVHDNRGGSDSWGRSRTSLDGVLQKLSSDVFALRAHCLLYTSDAADE